MGKIEKISPPLSKTMEFTLADEWGQNRTINASMKIIFSTIEQSNHEKGQTDRSDRMMSPDVPRLNPFRFLLIRLVLTNISQIPYKKWVMERRASALKRTIKNPNFVCKIEKKIECAIFLLRYITTCSVFFSDDRRNGRNHSRRSDWTAKMQIAVFGCR